MKGFTIGDQCVGPDERTFVIAEAGSNHNGELELAKKLIDVAANAGADAVKFQTFRADELYLEDSGTVEHVDDERSIYEVVESMEMPYEWIPELYEYCRDRDVFFMSTPFDERSIDELLDYVPAWKVASFTCTHHPFLRTLAGTDKPVIMSTGAHEKAEIRESVDVLEDAGVDGLALLQCVSVYPTPLSEINVRAVETLRETFDVLTGLSDHTCDPVVAPSAAVALGASVVEKHVTLDKSMEGPDHEFALEPDEFDRMVTAIRQTERALGDGTVGIRERECPVRARAKLGIHAATDIEEGERIGTEQVTVVRPGQRERGLEPKHLDDVVGARARINIEYMEGITWDLLQ